MAKVKEHPNRTEKTVITMSKSVKRKVRIKAAEAEKTILSYLSDLIENEVSK